MNSYPVDHVGIAVSSIDDSRSLFEFLTDATCSPVENLDAQGVAVAFVGSLELLEPLGPESPVARFLERRGPGMHHVALRVPDLEEALERCRRQGLELVDESPRPGARGHRVAFLHPGSTGGVLIELVEA